MSLCLRPKHSGSGTALDTARLRCLLSEKLDVNSSCVHAYVIGEHGDSSVCVWSSANVGGIRLADLSNLQTKRFQDIQTEVQRAAYEIIDNKGAHAKLHVAATAPTLVLHE